MTKGSCWTYPQGCDSGRVTKPALLIFQIVALWPLIPLADFPQLHSFICRGQPEEISIISAGKLVKECDFGGGGGGKQGEVEVMMEGTATETGSCQGLQCINLTSSEGRAHVSKQKPIMWRQMVSVPTGC